MLEMEFSAFGRWLGASVFGCAVLSGCVAPPEFPRQVKVSEVVDNTRCELYEAIQAKIGQYPWIGRWSAGFDFSFVVDRDANAAVDTAYVVPVTLGTFGIGFKGDLKQKARGSYVVKYKITKGLEKFQQAGCSGPASRNGGRLLSGETGLRRWLDEVIPQIEAARIENERKGEPGASTAQRPYTGEVEGLSYTIEFAVTVNGSLLPSWKLTHSSKRQFNPGFNFTLAEATTHKMIVALAPIAERKAPPDESEVFGLNGKKERVVIARRVCVLNGQSDGPCDTKEATAAIEALKQAQQERDEAKRVELSATKALETAVAPLAAAKPSIAGRAAAPGTPAGAFDVRKLDDAKIRELTGADNVAAARSIGAARDQVLRAQEASRAAEQRVRETQKAVGDISRVTREQAELARQAAQARARADAERDVSARLDQLIQQQVIRDAFAAR